MKDMGGYSLYAYNNGLFEIQGRYVQGIDKKTLQ